MRPARDPVVQRPHKARELLDACALIAQQGRLAERGSDWIDQDEIAELIAAYHLCRRQ